MPCIPRPGEATFRRFTVADTHVQTYTDPSNGQQTVSNITAMAGGIANEVFVGYRGYEAPAPPPAPPPCCVANADFSDPRWHLGQADKVTLDPGGGFKFVGMSFSAILPSIAGRTLCTAMILA